MNILLDTLTPLLPTCLDCGRPCLASERRCFPCQLEASERVVAEDVEAEHE